MTFSVQYKSLFAVQILHNYFLNKGEQLYAEMNQTDKQKQLALYNISQFLRIEPTGETVVKLNGYGLVFKSDTTGFKVWCKVENDGVTPVIAIDDNTCFTFLLKIADRRFYNFTSLKMENAGKLYYLSNLKPAGAPPAFPLIKTAGANTKTDESWILSTELQNAELKKLTTSKKTDLLALVRLYIKGDNSNLYITNATGKLKDPTPVFEILLDNRKSFWRYIFKTNQVVKPANNVKKEDGNAKILITKTEQPLTERGFVSVELGTAELPNPGIDNIIPDTAANKYYSEIYM
ncbi:MAG: hypothetical protein AB7S72_08095 [Draconibacterium sp.]